MPGLPAPPAWLDELDLHVGPPDATMGTRSLDPAAWFVVDDDWDAQRAAAAALLDERRGEVLVGTDHPGVGEASSELLGEVRRWLGEHGAGAQDPRPEREGGAQDPRPEREALAAARLLVADDLCLLLPEPGGGWLLAAGCVCFPSYWRPRDRIGHPLGAVHAPVPGYPGRLEDRVDGFLGRLRPGRGVWRRNWSVHDVPDLHLPGPVDVPRPTPVPEGRWLRSERQTLVRLPSSGAVVFTIRTQQVPLAALTGRPDRCRELAAALRGWSDAQRAYKGSAVDDALLAWLDHPTG
ncbi:MAG TPA: DUF3445 domain-containing protein [Acidimicrobiales bacterium]|nr:DUF3445 domain-containing protein [Acidimicrobiales bacterium]